MRLLLFHDFSSPFSRLAFVLAVRAAEATGAELVPLPFELTPAPAPLPPPDDAGITDEMARARPLAQEWGIELNAPATVPRTRKAHEAVEFARGQGKALAVAARIYDAHWSEGRDITRVDVLAALGADVGLDRDGVHVALGLDTHASDVAASIEAATVAGVDGVPTLAAGDRTLVGLVPERELIDWIRGPPSRPG